MNGLTSYLAALVRDTLKQPDWHNWRIPTTFPIAVALAPGSLLDQTRALKFALSEAYAREESRRVELATYFVRDWGGVRGNRASTLQRYVLNEAEAVSREQGITGISSWSKVLHLRDPRRFFICDARIAVVLNLVQLSNALTKPLAFPMPDSKSHLIKPARRRLAAIARQGRWRQPSPHVRGIQRAPPARWRRCQHPSRHRRDGPVFASPCYGAGLAGQTVTGWATHLSCGEGGGFDLGRQ